MSVVVRVSGLFFGFLVEMLDEICHLGSRYYSLGACTFRCVVAVFTSYNLRNLSSRFGF